MQVSELIEVLVFIEQRLGVGLQQQYAQLQQQLTVAAQVVRSGQPVGQAQAQINAARETILTLQLESEPPASWPERKRRAFRDLGTQGALGASAADQLSQLLSDNIADLPTASNAVASRVQQLQALAQRVGQTLQALRSLPHEQPVPAQAPSGDVGVVVISFDGKVQIDRLDQLAEWAKTWEMVFQTFATLTRSENASPELIDVQRGSLLVFLSAAVPIVAGLSVTVAQIMTAWEKKLSIKKLTRDLSEAEDEPESTPETKAILERAENKFAATPDVVSTALLDANDWKGTERNELEGKLRLSVKNVKTFVERGGRVELRLPQTASTPTAQAALERANQTYTQINEATQQVDELLEALDEMKDRQLSE